MSKLFSIMWVSNYHRMPKESKVFSGESESSVVKQTLHWILENSNGIDMDSVREIMEENNELIDEDDDEEEDKLMERIVSECNTVGDLKRKCKKYGNSYYEDKEGWKLIVMK